MIESARGAEIKQHAFANGGSARFQPLWEQFVACPLKEVDCEFHDLAPRFGELNVS